MTALDPVAVAGAAAAVLGIGVPVGAALLRRTAAPAMLCCIGGPLAGHEWALTHALRIGRGVDSHLRIVDAAASRRHALIEATGRRVWVRDLGSVDGVWADGRRIFDAMLGVGDQFQIGENVFLLAAGDMSMPQPRVHRIVEASQRSAIEFELESLVHTGHRCTVMRARRTDDGTGAPLIVKYRHDRGAAARSSLERFAAASRTWHAAHPALVCVHAVAAAAPQPYVIEESVIGASLRSRAADGADAAEISEVLAGLQDVLARMHRQGITHGALDAGDVLIGADGQIRLLNAGVQWTASERGGERADIDALERMSRELLGRGLDARREKGASGAVRVEASVGGVDDAQIGYAPLRLHVRTTGRTTLVTANPFLLGRALNPADRRISRWHGELRFCDNVWTVRPRVGYEIARNGVPVAGASVIFVGDELTLGATTILVGE